MHVVAVHGTDPGDTSLRAALAAALGCTAYEARARLVGAGPSVVAQHADPVMASAVAARLQAAGFQVLLRDVDVLLRPERWKAVRGFELLPPGGRVTTREGRRAAMRWDDIGSWSAGRGSPTRPRPRCGRAGGRATGRGAHSAFFAASTHSRSCSSSSVGASSAASHTSSTSSSSGAPGSADVGSLPMIVALSCIGCAGSAMSAK